MSLFLVTGGAGFIGSHLVDALVRRGHRVRVVDNLATGKRQNLAHQRDIDFVLGDLADPGVAARAVAGCEFVLHEAALPSVARSVTDPLASHRANVDATLNVLVAAREAGVRRVVFAGSSSVLGDTPEMPKHERMTPRPRSPYGLQKLIGEQYCQLFAALYGLDAVTTRYFNVFGPRQDASSPYAAVVSRFITALLEGRRPTIYGDGEQTRDFTHVANVVDGVLRACDVPGLSGRVINLATGGRVSVNQLFRAVQRVVGSGIEPAYADARAGEIRNSEADISLARSLLDYAPLVSFEDGLRQTVEWYRASEC